MLRIAVVGTTCSGKTTLASQIADALSIKHIELDTIHWGPNWTPKPIHQFRGAVETETAKDEWVIDGNYAEVRHVIWSRATHLVWLNYPFSKVFLHAISRTFRRVITQEELFSGNRETFGQALLDRESTLWWVIRTYNRRRREYRELIESRQYPQLRVFELRNPAEARDLISKLTGAG